MKKILFFFILAMFVISGCATCWYQEGKTLEDCRNDWLFCYNLAEKRIIKEGEKDYFGVQKAKLTKQCMKSIGYQVVPEEQLPEGVRRTKEPFTIKLAGK